MSATEVLSALDRIHGTVSVIGSMNADYTVTAQRARAGGDHHRRSAAAAARR